MGFVSSSPNCVAVGLLVWKPHRRPVRRAHWTKFTDLSGEFESTKVKIKFGVFDVLDHVLPKLQVFLQS